MGFIAGHGWGGLRLVFVEQGSGEEIKNQGMCIGKATNGQWVELTKGRDSGEEGRRAVIDGVVVALLPSFSSSFSGARFTSCAAVVHWTREGRVYCLQILF